MKKKRVSTHWRSGALAGVLTLKHRSGFADVKETKRNETKQRPDGRTGKVKRVQKCSQPGDWGE